MTLIDSYGTANQDSSIPIRNEHPSANANPSAAGQSLTIAAGDPYILQSIKFYLKKNAAPTGNLIVKVYAVTGTVGTTAVPTGSALAESQEINAALLTTSHVLYTFGFTGANQIILAPDTSYAFAVEANSANFDAANAVDTGVDGSTPTHSGNAFSYANSAWDAHATTDTVFYLYGWKYTDTFNRIKRRIEKALSIDTTVTCRRLQLGNRNTTTGHRAVTYSEANSIDMIIINPTNRATIHSVAGIIGSYMVTGLTFDDVHIGDQIETMAGWYQIRNINVVQVGDRFVYRECELEYLPMYIEGEV